MSDTLTTESLYTLNKVGNVFDGHVNKKLIRSCVCVLLFLPLIVFYCYIRNKHALWVSIYALLVTSFSL